MTHARSIPYELRWYTSEQALRLVDMRRADRDRAPQIYVQTLDGKNTALDYEMFDSIAAVIGKTHVCNMGCRYRSWRIIQC